LVIFQKRVAGVTGLALDRFVARARRATGLKGLVNVPLADTLALRASAKYSYEPGYIDVYGLLKRSNNGLTGTPLLANPADVINSPAIYTARNDWNFQKSFTGRMSALWKPNGAFSAQLAFLHSTLRGDGGPSVNPDFAGGISGFQSAVDSFIQQGNAYPFMVDTLKTIVLPHGRILAFLVAYGELAIGLSLASGILVRTASVFSAIYMTALISCASYPGDHVPFWRYFASSLEHSVFLLCFVTFAVSDSAEEFSIPASRWWLSRGSRQSQSDDADWL